MSDNPEAAETTIRGHTITRLGARRRVYNEDGDCVLDVPATTSDEAISIALGAMQRERQTGVHLGRAAVQHEFRQLMGVPSIAELQELRDRLEACESGVNVLMGQRR